MNNNHQHIIKDPPDVNGLFVYTPKNLEKEISHYDVRACSKYMKENNIILKPGEMLDPAIRERFRIG